MHKKTNGSLEKVSRDKNLYPNSTNKQFQDILASFAMLNIVKEDPVRHEFDLITAARSLKIPIASYRKMYRAWQQQQEEQA